MPLQLSSLFHTRFFSPLSEKTIHRALKIFEALRNPFNILHDLFPVIMHQSGHIRLPHYNTDRRKFSSIPFCSQLFNNRKTTSSHFIWSSAILFLQNLLSTDSRFYHYQSYIYSPLCTYELVLLFPNYRIHYHTKLLVMTYSSQYFQNVSAEWLAFSHSLFSFLFYILILISLL